MDSLLFAYVLISCVIPACSSTSISIGDEPILKTQRSCVVKCVGRGDCTFGDDICGVAVQLGCAGSNECFCRSDLRPSASSFLSSCIYTAFTTCADTVDYVATASIYDNYCSFTAPATTTATATGTFSTANGNAPVTATVSSSSAVQPSSSTDRECLALFVCGGRLGFSGFPFSLITDVLRQTKQAIRTTAR
ncbi:hypothetical protein B0O99DRAFT_646356 [Bisporella sp. PMI_857]|nr:hypothetical protein B0O99DRAFT_646356 [Bisporella sp. PMI_857]